MEEQTALYLILNNYRSPNKNEKKVKGKKREYFDFKKGDYAFAIPYKGNSSSLQYGGMIIVEDKFIIPSNFVKLLTQEEAAIVLKNYEESQKQQNNQNDIVQEVEPLVPTVEKLNEEGQSEVKESTDKLKNMSLNEIKKLKNSYTSTGIFLGTVGGIILAMYLKKNIWMSIGIVAGGSIVGGIIGNNVQKRNKKIFDATDEVENSGSEVEEVETINE